MADEEQLAILRQGPEAWNAWRQGRPNKRVDLSWAYISEVNLRGANLSGTDLRGAEHGCLEADNNAAEWRYAATAA